jgi:hypothetical protein
MRFASACDFAIPSAVRYNAPIIATRRPRGRLLVSGSDVVRLWPLADLLAYQGARPQAAHS